MKRLGRWLAETQAGRATFRLSVLALATLCVGGAVFAVIVNFGQESRITRVEHSACQEDAAGAECQKTKREAAQAANLATTCIPFFKAGYPCPKPGSTAAQRQLRRQAQAGSNSAEQLDSEPASPSPIGGGAGGLGAGHHQGTSGQTKQPPKSQGPQHKAEFEPSPLDTGTDTAPAESASEQTQAQPDTSTSEAPPGLIGNPGGVVGKTACDATEVVNELTGLRVCSK